MNAQIQLRVINCHSVMELPEKLVFDNYLPMVFYQSCILASSCEVAVQNQLNIQTMKNVVKQRSGIIHLLTLSNSTILFSVLILILLFHAQYFYRIKFKICCAVHCFTFGKFFIFILVWLNVISQMMAIFTILGQLRLSYEKYQCDIDQKSSI